VNGKSGKRAWYTVLPAVAAGGAMGALPGLQLQYDSQSASFTRTCVDDMHRTVFAETGR
jgi:hypothetical protein